MRTGIKIAVSSIFISILFNAVFAVLGYYSGIYSAGVTYYGWDAYWIVFSIGMGCSLGIIILIGLGFWLLGWIVKD